MLESWHHPLTLIALVVPYTAAHPTAEFGLNQCDIPRCAGQRRRAVPFQAIAFAGRSCGCREACNEERRQASSSTCGGSHGRSTASRFSLREVPLSDEKGVVVGRRQ